MSDLFWQHRTQGSLAVWRMNGTNVVTGLSLSASPADANWRAAGVCDLDGDGFPDIVLQHATTGALAAWYLTGETVRFGVTLSPSNAGDPSWKVTGPR